MIATTSARESNSRERVKTPGYCAGLSPETSRINDPMLLLAVHNYLGFAFWQTTSATRSLICSSRFGSNSQRTRVWASELSTTRGQFLLPIFGHTFGDRGRVIQRLLPPLHRTEQWRVHDWPRCRHIVLVSIQINDQVCAGDGNWVVGGETSAAAAANRSTARVFGQ